MRLDEGCVLVLPAQRIRGAVAHFRRGAAPSPGKRGPAGMSPEPGAVPAGPARRAPRARHLLPSGPRTVEGLPASSSGLHLIREPPPHLDPGTLPPAARPVSRAVSFQHHVLERPTVELCPSSPKPPSCCWASPPVRNPDVSSHFQPRSQKATPILSGTGCLRGAPRASSSRSSSVCASPA